MHLSFELFLLPGTSNIFIRVSGCQNCQFLVVSVVGYVTWTWILVLSEAMLLGGSHLLAKYCNWPFFCQCSMLFFFILQNMMFISIGSLAWTFTCFGFWCNRVTFWKLQWDLFHICSMFLYCFSNLRVVHIYIYRPGYILFTLILSKVSWIERQRVLKRSCDQSKDCCHRLVNH